MSEVTSACSPLKHKSVPKNNEESPSSSNLDKLWKTDPWAALHSIVGIFYNLFLSIN